MKKIVFILVFIALLILDYAALDDITTGNEPNFLLEYLFLVLSIPLFWFLGVRLIKAWKLR